VSGIFPTSLNVTVWEVIYWMVVSRSSLAQNHWQGI
jgi:hypothetical protein